MVMLSFGLQCINWLLNETKIIKTLKKVNIRNNVKL